MSHIDVKTFLSGGCPFPSFFASPSVTKSFSSADTYIIFLDIPQFFCIVFRKNHHEIVRASIVNG